jgi:Na+/proline symporter
MTWTRWAVVGIAIVSAWIALRPPGGIVEITIFSGSLYAVCFLPAILLGLHWRRGTAGAVLASMGVGTVVLLVWLLTGLGDVLHEVFPALLASCVTYGVIALASPPALARWPTSK